MDVLVEVEVDVTVWTGVGIGVGAVVDAGVGTIVWQHSGLHFAWHVWRTAGT